MVWTPVAGATGYKVHWGTTPGTDATGSPATLSSYASSNDSITGLTASTTYYITVVATSAAFPNGNASTSSMFTATTQATGTTTSINYSAGFTGSTLTASAGFDPTANLVFNALPRLSSEAEDDTTTGPSITADHRLELGTGGIGNYGWSAFNRTLVNVDQFTTDFTVQTASNGGGDRASFNFVLQSDSPINWGENNRLRDPQFGQWSCRPKYRDRFFRTKP